MKQAVFVLLVMLFFTAAGQKRKMFKPAPCDPILLAGNYKNGDTIAESDVGALIRAASWLKAWAKQNCLINAPTELIVPKRSMKQIAAPNLNL